MSPAPALTAPRRATLPPRYSRTALAPTRRRPPLAAPVLPSPLVDDRGEVLADEYVDSRLDTRTETAEAAPATATRVRRGWTRSIRAMALTAALLATGSGVVALSTNAYFTSTREKAASVAPGTLKFDMLTTADAVNPTFTVANLVPLSAADANAVTPTTGKIVQFKVKAGSLPTRGTVTLATPASTPSALLGNVKAQFWIDGALGGRWSTVAALNSTTLPTTGEIVLNANESKTLKLRVFLDQATPNALQGGSITFTLTAKGIQSVAPAGTAY